VWCESAAEVEKVMELDRYYSAAEIKEYCWQGR
jgi:hypothetical protein